MAEFLCAKGSALTEIKLRACTQTAGLHQSAKAFACDGADVLARLSSAHPYRMRRSEWSKGQRRMRQRPLRHIRGGLRGTAPRTAAPPAIEQSDSQPRGVAVQCRQQLGRCQRRSVMHGSACMVQRGLSVPWMRWCRISQRSAGGQFSTSFRFTNMGTHFTSMGTHFTNMAMIQAVTLTPAYASAKASSAPRTHRERGTEYCTLSRQCDAQYSPLPSSSIQSLAMPARRQSHLAMHVLAPIPLSHACPGSIICSAPCGTRNNDGASPRKKPRSLRQHTMPRGIPRRVRRSSAAL